MLIRDYTPGDEVDQVRIYNADAASLPAFKPANVDEVLRRFASAEFDPGAKLYAEADGAVVGYAVFNPNGRVSYPWCAAGHDDARRPLLDGILSLMRDGGFAEAWAAYRDDWAPVQAFFREYGFEPARGMVNFVAEAAELPDLPAPPGTAFTPLSPDDLPRLLEVGRGLFAADADRLAAFYWDNPHVDPGQFVALRPLGGGPIAGAALAVVDPRFADPAKVDPAMPCFRLGALGTETDRHKRINGMCSVVFRDEAAGAALLSEAARRFRRAGVSRAAAQAQADRPDLVAFYETYFRRQGSFPILVRRPV